MPAILPNTQTANAYPAPNQSGGAQVGLNDVYASGYFVIANAAALAQYQHGVQGQQDFSADIFLPPATYPLIGSKVDPLGGIKFKSAVPGVPAQVFGVLYKENESALLAGSEFGAQVSPSGGISAGGAALTGTVSSAGAQLAGTGYAVVRSALGTYDITYTTPFPAAPVVLAIVEQTANTPFAIVTLRNAASVRINVIDSVTRASIDAQFSFAVFIMV